VKRKFQTAAVSLPLILAVALGLRLGFAWHYQSQRPTQALAVIPFLFESGNIASSLAAGNGFSSPFRVDTGPTAWMTPVYPLLLAGVFRLFGVYTFHAWLAAVGLNILFCTVACVPIFFAGKRVGGLGVAATAAWLWAVFPNAILIPAESMWEACLAALLGATLLWATLALAGSQRIRDWCAYGLLWGVALMTEATFASLLPLLLGWLAYRTKSPFVNPESQVGVRDSGFGIRRSAAGSAFSSANPEPRTPKPADFPLSGVSGRAPGRDGDGLPWPARSALRGPALAGAVAILCCVPWTVRNYEVFHRFVPLRSILGLQLYVGNNPRAREIWLGENHPIHDEAERDRYTELGEIAYAHEKLQAALRYMQTHPRREAHLIAYRFVAIWAGGTPHPVTDFVHDRSPQFRAVLLFNLFVAVGALLGIVALCRARSVYAFPIAVFPIVYPCAYYLTLALPRYSLPIDPIVMLLTAVALRSAISRQVSTETQTRDSGG